MSLISFTHDQNSVLLRIKILDSSVATGAGKTGLVFGDSGLIISTIADNEATATAYTSAGALIETVTTLGTYATPTASKCRFREVDATNHPGVYEMQFVDARFGVASAKSLLISVLGVTNAAESDALIPLTQVDPYDAAAFGMTNLDAVLTARTKATADYFDWTTDTVANVTLCATTTTNTDSAASFVTAQADLDIITGADGVNLLTATQASIDAIETDTTTDIPALIATAQADLDTITGASGVILLTATQASIDAIETDTTTDIPALIATAQADLDTITGAAGALLDTTATSAALVDDVWDEPLTGASHNDPTSSGRRLRQVEEAFIHASGTIAVVTDGHTITLDAGAVATADYYIGDRLQIVEGTGEGQSRVIVGYTSGKVVTLDSDFTTNPNASSLYEVVAADVHVSVSDADLATGFLAAYTNTTTITLDTAAEATEDFYNGERIVFTHGAGSGQSREILDYTAGRVVTLAPALVTALNTTTTYHIQTSVSIEEIVDEVWDEAQSDHTAAGTFGEIATETAAILVDTTAIKSDLPQVPTTGVAFSDFTFLMVLSSDHVTPATGLTFLAANSQVSIDSVPFVNTTNVPTEVSAGVYTVDLSAADMAGSNSTTLKFTGTASDQRTVTLPMQPT